MNISSAESHDLAAMLELFPRLAAFELPANRNPLHLWEGDAEMLRDWAAGECPECLVHVAKDDDDNLLGLTMVTLRPELLSHAPSAHLEAIVVAKEAEGSGIAKALMKTAEMAAIDRGAKSMSLHVFTRNERARRVYERAGFDGELMRYIKPFSDDAFDE